MKFPYTIVDLTHTLHEDVVTWDGECGFSKQITIDYKEFTSEVKFRVQHFNMRAGVGTHIDTPAHAIPGGLCVDQISLNDLIAPCVVIDQSKHMHERLMLSVQNIQEFEEQYGIIEPRSLVIFRSGWEQYWNDPECYRNNHVFPSVSIAAAEYLMQRDIVGIGIDTLSPDIPENDYPVHALLLGAWKYILENVANSGSLPPTGSYILALPIKVLGGTEAPIRLIGLCNKF